LVGLSDSTRANGLNCKVGLASVDNLDAERFRNASKEYAKSFVNIEDAGYGDAVAGDVTVDVVGNCGNVAGVAGVAGADSVADDADFENYVVDFDDNCGRLVYYDDFDSSFDIDVPVDNYSLLAYDGLEQVLWWSFQGAGTLGEPESWNGSLADSSHG
jgi:hypothetical protein